MQTVNHPLRDSDGEEWKVSDNNRRRALPNTCRVLEFLTRSARRDATTRERK